MINHRNTVHVEHSLNKYREWDGQAVKVLCGHVDATIHGRYFGDKLRTEQKTILRDLALEYVSEEMLSIRQNLVSFGVVFDDGVIDVGDMIRYLHEVHGEEVSAHMRANESKA